MKQKSKTPVRVAITGAAGQIGYQLAFRIASGQLFGSEQPIVLQLLEIAPAAELFAAPRHPYALSLLSAIPRIGSKRVTDTFTLEGEPPDAGNLPSGCRFRIRCPLSAPVCAEREPQLALIGENHATA